MKLPVLILGDILALALVTIIGFVTHGETDLSFLPRMGMTFFPLLVAWFLVSPWLDLFDGQVTLNRRMIWRPALAMILAAPMAVVLRAAMLNSAAHPVFKLILGASGAVGMLFWRGLYAFLRRKK
jgi:hypothetical protein